MIRILSIFLLIIYSLTSTGATVYYHACGQESKISLSEKGTNHASCGFCSVVEKNHHNGEDCGHSDNSCDLKGSCCTDVQVELKNSTDQVVTNLLKDFNALSPFELIIPWIVVFHHIWTDASAQVRIAPNDLLASNTYPDPYLLYCNFRI